jgi:hypothetical protein
MCILHNLLKAKKIDNPTNRRRPQLTGLDAVEGSDDLHASAIRGYLVDYFNSPRQLDRFTGI